MDLPDDTSEAADWGTCCHQIAEVCLREGRDAAEWIDQTVTGKKFSFECDDEMAEKEYRAAVKYAPEDGEVNNNYGAFLCGIGKEKEAEPYFVTAVDDPFYDTPEIALSLKKMCARANPSRRAQAAKRTMRNSADSDASRGTSRTFSGTPRACWARNGESRSSTMLGS